MLNQKVLEKSDGILLLSPDSDILFCLVRAMDPIFSLATPLQPEEEDSSTREDIAPPHQPENCSSVSGQQTAVVQGGWFGRGYGKGKRKKKAS